MADLSGIQVIATVVPTSDSDTHATHDSIYGKGGATEAADVTAREAITTARRSEGMTCYQVDTAATWQLQGGVANSNWAEVTGGAGSTTLAIINGTSLMMHFIGL